MKLYSTTALKSGIFAVTLTAGMLFRTGTAEASQHLANYEMLKAYHGNERDVPVKPVALMPIQTVESAPVPLPVPPAKKEEHQTFILPVRQQRYTPTTPLPWLAEEHAALPVRTESTSYCPQNDPNSSDFVPPAFGKVQETTGARIEE